MGKYIKSRSSPIFLKSSALEILDVLRMTFQARMQSELKLLKINTPPNDIWVQALEATLSATDTTMKAKSYGYAASTLLLEFLKRSIFTATTNSTATLTTATHDESAAFLGQRFDSGINVF